MTVGRDNGRANHRPIIAIACDPIAAPDRGRGTCRAIAFGLNRDQFVA